MEKIMIKKIPRFVSLVKHLILKTPDIVYIKILFIQNISPFLIGSNSTAYSSWPATAVQIWKMFSEISKTDVNSTYIDTKEKDSRRRGRSAVWEKLEKKRKIYKKK